MLMINLIYIFEKAKCSDWIAVLHMFIVRSIYQASLNIPCGAQLHIAPSPG